MFVEIIFSIISILSLIFCILVIVDSTIFSQKIKEVRTGMTGKQVQEATNMKIRILKVEGNVYYARLSSYLTMFRYRLVFCNGRLLSKQRD